MSEFRPGLQTQTEAGGRAVTTDKVEHTVTQRGGPSGTILRSPAGSSAMSWAGVKGFDFCMEMCSRKAVPRAGPGASVNSEFREAGRPCRVQHPQQEFILLVLEL